jgi:hypothetical protein
MPIKAPSVALGCRELTPIHNYDEGREQAHMPTGIPENKPCAVHAAAGT